MNRDRYPEVAMQTVETPQLQFLVASLFLAMPGLTVDTRYLSVFGGLEVFFTHFLRDCELGS